MRVHRVKNSTAVERVGYDDESHCLSVWFRGGRRYIYSNVPHAIYEALCSAASAGRFVTEAIKGKYPCREDPPRRFRPAS